MMTMIRKILPSIFLIIIPLLGYSQTNDFGIWYCVNGEIRLVKSLYLDLSGNIRTFKDASKVDESFGEVGVTYNISKHFSVAGAYRLTDKIENDLKYHVIHKWFADVKAGGDLSRISLSGRFRFQIQQKTYMKNYEDSIPYYHGRLKLSAKYKTRKFPIDPYIAFETFWPMFKPTENKIDKNRFTIGLEYKINKHHSFDLEYIFQRDFKPTLSDMSIISIAYNFKI
jgi:hypothetical protein